MLFAVIATTDGARLHADRTDRGMINVATGAVLMTEAVIALLHCQMLDAKRGVAEVTLRHTLLAAFLVTLFAKDCLCCQLPTARTFVETIQTEGFAAAIALKEAWADSPPAFAASD